MMRVTTLFARAAAATAGYYTRYLTEASGELPGQWLGEQADRFGLTGEVTIETLEALLSGLDPVTGRPLGHPLVEGLHRALWGRSWQAGRAASLVGRSDFFDRSPRDRC